MQATEPVEQQVKPPEVARRLRVSQKSAYRWHQLWRDGDVQALVSRVRAALDAVCPLVVWRSWPGIRRRGRPRTAG
uniref:Transposase n=1 Tax=Streptomyces sp. NBC_01393 TaxID=2903851 RepID=A0AAU3HR55_9ACTN